MWPASPKPPTPPPPQTSEPASQGVGTACASSPVQCAAGPSGASGTRFSNASVSLRPGEAAGRRQQQQQQRRVWDQPLAHGSSSRSGAWVRTCACKGRQAAARRTPPACGSQRHRSTSPSDTTPLACNCCSFTPSCRPEAASSSQLAVQISTPTQPPQQQSESLGVVIQIRPRLHP